MGRCWLPQERIILSSSGSSRYVARPRASGDVADGQVIKADDGARSLGISPIHHLTIDPRNDEWSSDGVDAIAWSPDGNTIVAAAYDRLSVWDTKVSIIHPQFTPADFADW